MKKIFRGAALFVVTLVLAAVAANFFYPMEPIAGRTDRFERKVFVTWGYPFLVPYYLLTPETIDPDREYPLVMVLHGASKQAQGAYILASDEMRQSQPAFVLVPMAPFNRAWATPDSPELKQPWFPALDLAVAVLEDVRHDYPVDADRIYVTGSSTGGFASFAAPMAYPEIFAASVPVASGWIVEDAADFPEIDVWAWHDRADDQVDIAYARAFVVRLRSQGINARLEEISGYGHAAWRAAYADPALWDWLFAQSR